MLKRCVSTLNSKPSKYLLQMPYATHCAIVRVMPSRLEGSFACFDHFLNRVTRSGEPLGYQGASLKVRSRSVTVLMAAACLCILAASSPKPVEHNMQWQDLKIMHQPLRDHRGCCNAKQWEAVCDVICVLLHEPPCKISVLVSHVHFPAVLVLLLCPSSSALLLARFFLFASFLLVKSSDVQACSQIASLLQAGCPTDYNKEMIYHLVGFSKGG